MSNLNVFIDLEKFKSQGYIHLENILTKEQIELTQVLTLKLKEDLINNNLLGEKKDFGVTEWWRGIDMSSFLSEDLYKLYTSPIMYTISSELLETKDVHLYNDQIVVKLPNEDFQFEPHVDNQFGPNPSLAQSGVFKTITCAWVLDEFTIENGAISILNKSTGEWDMPLPKTGDILVWDGETPHKSNNNITDKPRRVYLMVYGDNDIPSFGTEEWLKRFANRFYNKKFII